MKQLVHKYLDERAIRVLEGGIPLTTAVLKQKFDYICYTGNTFVGKIVMRAASEHLTPVILELGGKSPVVVDPSSISNDAAAASVARRILFGKYFNSGQTCVAPDYVLVPEGEPRRRLVAAMQVALLDFYGKDSEKSIDHGRMINKRHTTRVAKVRSFAAPHCDAPHRTAPLLTLTFILTLNAQLLEEIKSAPGVKITGGRIDVEKRFIEPTLVENPPAESQLMQEEIFGPILPIVPLAVAAAGRGGKAPSRIVSRLFPRHCPASSYLHLHLHIYLHLHSPHSVHFHDRRVERRA